MTSEPSTTPATRVAITVTPGNRISVPASEGVDVALPGGGTRRVHDGKLRHHEEGEAVTVDAAEADRLVRLGVAVYAGSAGGAR